MHFSSISTAWPRSCLSDRRVVSLSSVIRPFSIYRQQPNCWWTRGTLGLPEPVTWSLESNLPCSRTRVTTGQSSTWSTVSSCRKIWSRILSRLTLWTTASVPTWRKSSTFWRLDSTREPLSHTIFSSKWMKSRAINSFSMQIAVLTSCVSSITLL